MSTSPLSITDFASRIRSKYPGAYDQLSDTELTQKVIAKYPQYKEQVKLDQPKMLSATPAFKPPDESVVKNAGQRLKDILKGNLSLLDPRRRTDLGGQADLGALSPYTIPMRMARGQLQSEKQLGQQTAQSFRDSGGLSAWLKSLVKPPISPVDMEKELARNKTIINALSMLNPFATSAVANVNDLQNQGRNKAAAAQGSVDAILNALTFVRAPKLSTNPIRSATQGYMGIGERMATRSVAETLAEHASETAKTDEANAALATKHKDALGRMVKKQSKIYEETNKGNEVAQKEHEKLTEDTKLQNIRAKAEYQAAADKVEQINKANAEKVGRRADLAKQITTDSTELNQQLKNLESKVRGEARAKYAVVDAAVEGSTVPATEMAEAIKHAETQIIKGSTESIKQFREILQRGEPQEFNTSVGVARPGEPLYDILVKQGAIEPTQPLTFRDLQGYYTELGMKMQGANVPGDVYRAMKYVREQLGEQMQGMAEKHGVGGELRDAKDFWRQYESTFHDLRAVSAGGSPVARAFRAADPGYTAAPFLGKASSRAIAMLSKYDQGVANLAAKVASDHAEMTSLPTKFTAKEPPALPKRKELPPDFVPKPPKLLDKPAAPKEKPAPPVPDVLEVLRQKRGERVGQISRSLRTVSGWDLASVSTGLYQIARGDLPTAFGLTVLRHGTGMLLDHPKVVEWLTKPTPKDFANLEKLPPADKAKVQAAIRQFYVRQASKGKLIPMNKAVTDFLLSSGKATVVGDKSKSYKSQLAIAERVGDKKWASRLKKLLGESE